MLHKVFSKTGRACRVTFILPSEVEADTASICGEFNGWSPDTHPLKRRKDGSLACMMWLETGRQYRFRYWLNNERWENDWAADAYLPNPFGSEDSVLAI